MVLTRSRRRTATGVGTLVAFILCVLAGAELSRARGGLADLVSGWSAVIFAAALAGFLTAFLSVHAGLYAALLWALGGAGYGLITGWIIGLAQMGTRRP